MDSCRDVLIDICLDEFVNERGCHPFPFDSRLLFEHIQNVLATCSCFIEAANHKTS